VELTKELKDSISAFGLFFVFVAALVVETNSKMCHGNFVQNHIKYLWCKYGGERTRLRSDHTSASWKTLRSRQIVSLWPVQTSRCRPWTDFCDACSALCTASANSLNVSEVLLGQILGSSGRAELGGPLVKFGIRQLHVDDLLLGGNFADPWLAQLRQRRFSVVEACNLNQMCHGNFVGYVNLMLTFKFGGPATNWSTHHTSESLRHTQKLSFV
jgi:hypothetical protein